MKTPQIVLRHFAFIEGQRGHANGCARYQNPYYNAEGNVDQHDRECWEQWVAGWTERNEKEQKKGD